jgi:hypothetical protein
LILRNEATSVDGFKEVIYVQIDPRKEEHICRWIPGRK